MKYATGNYRGLIGVGLFYILVDLYKIPYYKTSQAVDNISQKQKHKTSFLDAHLGSIARWLSGKIRIDCYIERFCRFDDNIKRLL